MRHRGLMILGIALIILGVAFAALDKEWIEENLGFEPDGGNGALELLLAVVPIAVGIGLLAYAWLKRPAPDQATQPTTDPGSGRP